LNNFIFISRGQ